MSHYATNWAIRQKGLRPATKIVLWHLCDRHNPDVGCFPSQDRLAADCEMSRSALNGHLRALEERGIIRREQRVNERTKRQESTRYVFAFEEREAQDVVEPCPESEHGAVSGFEADPCPDLMSSRVQIPDTNPVREPVKEPKKGRAKRPDPEGFDAFWSLWKDYQRKSDGRGKARPAFQEMLDAGATAQDIIDGARWYLRNLSDRDKPYIPLAASWLRSERWAEDCEQERTYHHRLQERERQRERGEGLAPLPRGPTGQTKFLRQWQKQPAE